MQMTIVIQIYNPTSGEFPDNIGYKCSGHEKQVIGKRDESQNLTFYCSQNMFFLQGIKIKQLNYSVFKNSHVFSSSLFFKSDWRCSSENACLA